MPTEHYDAIIIGSGIGGLACASTLAQQQGKRVLVLERHFKVGGFTHTFVRKGKYEWDVGIHYIGDMQKGRESRAIFDYITQGGVQVAKNARPI
jgi:all-trans-retinol 13,14-reductase